MTMSLDEAMVALNVWSRQMEALQVVVMAYGDMKAVKQQRSEIDAQAADAMTRLANLNAAIDKGRATLQKIADDVDGKMQAAQDKADRLVTDAEAEATDIVTKANADAAALLLEAGVKVDKATNDLNALIVDGEARLADVTKMVNEEEAALALLTKENGELLDKVAKAKEYLAKLAGG